MPDAPPAGAFAIVPTADLPGSIAFWEQMGFARTGGEPTYVIMTGWDCEIHLRPADPPPWDVPAEQPVRSLHPYARTSQRLPRGWKTG